jgi:hypothetical protein
MWTLRSPKSSAGGCCYHRFPAQLPDKATWYLVSNLPHPGSKQAQESELAADLSEIVRLYGLMMWVEQSYKLVKPLLG